MRLESPSLILREFVAEDWPSVQAYASNLEVVRFLPFGPSSVEDTKTFLRTVMAQQKASPRTAYELAVTERSRGRLIGSCGLRVRDPVHRSGDIGYVVGKDRWGRGYGTEIAQTLIRFGFDELKLHRIWATCDPDNAASARVLEKAGMQREGRLRHDKQLRGSWRDSYLYAIVEDD